MIKAYATLVKPGIIFGNGVTAVAGMALASQGSFPLIQFLGLFMGVSFVIGSACVFNNYIDRKMDEKMVRTRNRPFVTGEASIGPALFFACLMGVCGEICLLIFGNPLAAGFGASGFFVYVVLYSLMKYHSVHATLVGSVAGAVPPVIGYVGIKGSFDLGALILFMMIVLWQMPHFFAIASFRLKEYAAASIPVLPLKRGMYQTKIQMALYILAFIPVSLLLFFYGYTGYIYLVLTLFLGCAWLVMALQGFKCANDLVWARKMFVFSLVVVMGISAAILG